MNRKIGMVGSAVNLAAVVCFAGSMLLGFEGGSYFFSMFIAFGFVAMMGGYAYFSQERRRVAGSLAMAFAAVYATIVLLVYFAQLTAVRQGGLTEQAAQILDFRQCGLLFCYDLLGYALMALATFFAGLTVEPRTRADKWLKYLLLVHGVFFVSCLVCPMLGIFQVESPAWIGVAVLEFWCVYFCPVGALSFLYFRRAGKE